MKMFVATLAIALGGIVGTAQAGQEGLEVTLGRITGTTVVCSATPMSVGGSGANSTDQVSGFYLDGSITLAPNVCSELKATLAGDFHRAGWKAAAWHTLAHEVGHARGYDHGEQTIGADCWGERHERMLMKRAGLPQAWRVSLQRFVVYSC